MKKLVRLEVLLPNDLKHRLSLEAARDNRSMAGVVIVAITQYLDHPKPTQGNTK